ncbi:hypothetical protein [Arthrobacter sp. N199823]|uniref:hypothetical protein n=1 Tax=Arthrobacter sp. N199823 TaxID=2058895 RepID=UPI0011B0888E|nr:hypothetical protein [Arthrobacter sp. N199823]
MSALNLSWDTPYRLLASFVSIGCACVLWGWVDASSPFDALGQLVATLGVHPAPDVAQNITDWLTMRQTVVVPLAWFFLLTGVAFNVGDGKGLSTIPGAWRGAPTALIALVVIWEVTPTAVPVLAVWAVVVAVVLSVAAFLSKNEKLGSWLGATFRNFSSSALLGWLVNSSNIRR